jgi:hypothetical protein
MSQHITKGFHMLRHVELLCCTDSEFAPPQPEGDSSPAIVQDAAGRATMAKAEASVEELVGMIERGELRLPEMQGCPSRKLS